MVSSFFSLSHSVIHWCLSVMILSSACSYLSFYPCSLCFSFLCSLPFTSKTLCLSHTHTHLHFPGAPRWRVFPGSRGWPPRIAEPIAEPAQLRGWSRLVKRACGIGEVWSLRACWLVLQAGGPAGAGTGQRSAVWGGRGRGAELAGGGGSEAGSGLCTELSAPGAGRAAQTHSGTTWWTHAECH